ncbi:MAG: adenylyl-sulfate kinase [Burkholderiales bacterium]
MFYESQELLRAHSDSSSLTGGSARRQSKHRQPERAESSHLLRFLTCGGVDDGKSTLIGRILKDLGLAPQDAREGVLAESERRNFSRAKPDYSLLLDRLLIEREQGITVDVAWRYFATSKRKFIVADCPGQEHHIRNMVTCASHCDAALVLVDARKGILSQTRRHLAVVAMMRVPSVLVVVNKMDLVHWDRTRFDAIRHDAIECASQLGLTEVIVVPVSAVDGGNVVHDAPEAPWYEGCTVLQALETRPARRQQSVSFRLVAQWINRLNQDFRGIAGQVLGAPLKVGDTIQVLPSNAQARVQRICTFDGDLQHARPGQAVTVVLDRALDVARGDWLVKAADVAPAVTDRLEANVVWVSETPLLPGRRYDLQIGCTTVPGSVRRIVHRLDVGSLKTHEAARLDCNDVGRCEIVLERLVPVDSYADSIETGGLIFIDRGTFHTEGAGMVTAVAGREVIWHQSAVDRNSRAAIKGHLPQVVWLTGLSGAGKSTIANALEICLNAMGAHTMLLDGDNVRHGLSRDLGFSETDRVENIRRIGETAKLMLDAGLVVITAFISPFRDDRQLVRELVREGEFLEVFVDAPLAVCEARDPKGLYRRARMGQIPNFTGVTQPYEPPLQPELRLDASATTVADSVQAILAALKAKGFHV